MGLTGGVSPGLESSLRRPRGVARLRGVDGGESSDSRSAVGDAGLRRILSPDLGLLHGGSEADLLHPLLHGLLLVHLGLLLLLLLLHLHLGLHLWLHLRRTGGNHVRWREPSLHPVAGTPPPGSVLLGFRHDGCTRTER